MRMIYLALLIFGMMFLSACQNENPSEEIGVETEVPSADTVAETDERDVFEKGYNLPVDEEAGKRAEEECKEVMEMIAEIYRNADKGIASNVVLSDQTMCQMKEVIKETGQPVTSSETYATMENYEKMEEFLYACMDGKKGSAVIYEVNYDGGIGRMEYFFDGTDMYVLAARAVWNQKNQPGVTYLSYTRINQWEYTEKGWFGYGLCVPEYPEVTEVVDGSCLIRVRPMTEEQRVMSEKCVLGLGYQGNNLLCSNWDTDHMEGIALHLLFNAHSLRVVLDLLRFCTFLPFHCFIQEILPLNYVCAVLPILTCLLLLLVLPLPGVPLFLLLLLFSSRELDGSW